MVSIRVENREGKNSGREPSRCGKKKEWEENSAGRVASGSEIGGKREEPFSYFFPFFPVYFPFFLPFFRLFSRIFPTDNHKINNMFAVR